MAPYPDYPIPADEEQRLRELERSGLLDSSSDQHFERILELARSIFQVPMAVISLVESERQRFLAKQGTTVQEMPREISICSHVIAGNGVMVVPDARADERFCTNPLVVNAPQIRFYAGAPLVSGEGHNIGTLCVFAPTPGQASPEQIRQLQLLAELVMREVELRQLAQRCPITGCANRSSFFTVAQREFAHALERQQPLALLCFDIDNLRQVNNRWGHSAGDQVLRDCARTTASLLGTNDYLARLGDGEFGVLMVNSQPERAMAVAEAIRQAISTMPGLHSHSDYQLHISGGLTAQSPIDGDFSAMFNRADAALQLAKTNGRNQIASNLSY